MLLFYYIIFVWPWPIIICRRRYQEIGTHRKMIAVQGRLILMREWDIFWQWLHYSKCPTVDSHYLLHRNIEFDIYCNGITDLKGTTNKREKTTYCNVNRFRVLPVSLHAIQEGVEGVGMGAWYVFVDTISRTIGYYLRITSPWCWPFRVHAYTVHSN